MSTDSKQTTTEQTKQETTENSDRQYAEERHELLSKHSKKGGKHYIDTTSPSHFRKPSCPYYFGVKSYLHNLYETGFKDPSIYEEDDYRYLLHPNPKRRRCPPIWMKICIWTGVNLLLFGIIGILVGYLVPQKSVIGGKLKDDGSLAKIDHAAVQFNTTLDLFKLIGLILFCVGGVILALALLFPSFLAGQCDEDFNDEAIRVNVGDEKAPLSPVDMAIPSTSKLKNVQPDRSKNQTIRPPSDHKVKD